MKTRYIRKCLFAFTLLIAISCMLTVGVSAVTRNLKVYDEEAGLYYDSTYSKFCYILNDDGTATVTGNPEGVAPEDGSENTFAYGSTSAKAIVPTFVKYDNVTYTVTEVAEDGFANHTSLKRVVFESEVKIGARAFLGCTALANVDLGDDITYIGDGAFSYCNLTSMDIPSSVTHIGNNAFYYNPSLATISGVTRDNITHIGSGAFHGTDWYKKLTDEFVIMGNGVLIKYNGTSEHITIPSDVVGIADAFAGKVNILSVDFSAATGLEYIGNNAFYGCKLLESITIPDSVKHIGDFAFASCYNLKTVTAGKGIESIGFCAFSGDDSLESFTCTSENLKSIGECIFWICSSLKSVNLASCPDILGFGYLWGAGIDTYEIPENIKTIDKGAFAGTSNIVVIVPKSVESIVANAFAGASVTYVCAPDSVAAEYAGLNFEGDSTKKVVFFGDVNGDGNVDIADLPHFIKYFAGNAEATLSNSYAGDTAFDGKVSLKDMSAMMKYLAGAENATIGK